MYFFVEWTRLASMFNFLQTDLDIGLIRYMSPPIKVFSKPTWYYYGVYSLRKMICTFKQLQESMYTYRTA
jgi:hypothetical protein